MSDKLLIGVLIAAAASLVAFQKLRSKGPSHKASERTRLMAVDAARSRPPSGECVDSAMRLVWPVSGVAGKDWVIANYVDHDKGTNRLRDYRGSVGEDAITYDGHQGVDIEIANFRVMDKGVPVLAAAEGVVEEIHDGAFDRNLHCSQEKWNFVRLKHANGSTVYGHLKRGSVAVRIGDRVRVGARLGLIGSSGCSTYPHLHFETWNCRGEVVDPIQNSLFIHMPEDVRSLRAGVMEVSLFQPSIDSITSIQDPGAEERSLISIGHAFSVGVTVSALRPGDVLSLELISPSRAHSEVFFQQTITQFLPRSHWWGNYRFETAGVWALMVKVNGRLLLEKPITATL